MKLALDYYLNPDVITLARDLLGKYIFTCVNGKITGGYIVETEAYNGIVDKASHAYGNRLTTRTKTMFKQGGIAYVYLCYGIHEMFNIVTSVKGQPQAVLVRAIQPVTGLEVMLERRNMPALKPNITSGPGSVAKALGISRAINGFNLEGNVIWLEDRGIRLEDKEIISTKRIGVQYAGNDAFLPYRYYIKGNIYVSKPNK